MASARGFLSSGMAALSSEGTVPVLSEEWMIVVIRGHEEGKQALIKTEGRGSSQHVVGFISWPG